MESEIRERNDAEEGKARKLVVEWNVPGQSGTDTGFQSREMMGAAESGCCRQGGSPCSPKKFS